MSSVEPIKVSVIPSQAFNFVQSVDKCNRIKSKMKRVLILVTIFSIFVCSVLSNPVATSNDGKFCRNLSKYSYQMDGPTLMMISPFVESFVASFERIVNEVPVLAPIYRTLFRQLSDLVPYLCNLSEAGYIPELFVRAFSDVTHILNRAINAPPQIEHTANKLTNSLADNKREMYDVSMQGPQGDLNRIQTQLLPDGTVLARIPMSMLSKNKKTKAELNASESKWTPQNENENDESNQPLVEFAENQLNY